MQQNRIKQLLHSYKSGELSATDQSDWDLLIGSADFRQQLQQLMEDEMLQVEKSGDVDMIQWKPVLERILQIDQPVLSEPPVIVQPRIRSMRRWIWPAAAALVLLFGAAYYLWTKNAAEDPSKIVKSLQEIEAGKEGAVLTLADGRKVVLDSLANGIIAMEEGAQVTLQNGALQYAQIGSEKKEPQYNIMTTPRGRQFRIVLPDGTEVWLNAESSISFPVEFNATERRVEITGEAFFHVKSLNLPAFNGRPAIKVPFVVNVNRQLDIEVLGTQFNVNAYTNEKAIKATLTEGVVRVRTPDRAGEVSQTAMLMPGQLAAVNNGSNQILVQDADLEKVMAWRNGLFNFENVSLADAMFQLERWYNIDVEYENGIPDIWFSGKISRETSLAGLLKILEKTGVQFRLNGRKLTVLRDH
ncbi:DUF4974 domain-containing protein [Pseudoflavitalea sp. G-6-1-2]|uniref:FecR family protein n=1 Tax=Pseudoflavitalea sp. G-6-1-2 TaxID=2728841 RepID=UPI00146F481A|nr:FecR family protein [Pseudoflavitalea sp. G-6-1-2]NML22776.1 DUF4974 domain-containing protein [Pseudoflavitalea sp. G-6-1-2]